MCESTSCNIYILKSSINAMSFDDKTENQSVTMNVSIERLVTLLDRLLDLQTEAGTHESKTSSLYGLLSKFPLDGNAQGSIRDYVELEISQRFLNLKSTDRNFLLDAEAWEHLATFDYEQNEIIYSVVLQVIISLMNNSLINKQVVANEVNIKELIKGKIEQTTNDLVSGGLIELYYQILSVSCTPSDLLYLYTNLPEYKTQFFYILNNLGEELSDPYSECYLEFENCYQRYDLNTPKEQLTISIWIEFLNITSNRIFTIGQDLSLEVKENTLSISNDEFILGIFDMFDILLFTLYHITILIDRDNITLYVDGTYVQSLNILHGSVQDIYYIELGSMMCLFKLYRLILWGGLLPESSIQLADQLVLFRNPPKEWNNHNDSIIPKVPGTLIEQGTVLHVAKDNIELDVLPSRWIAVMRKDPTTYTVSLSEDTSLHNSKCFYYQNANIISSMDTIYVFRIIVHLLGRAEDMDYFYKCLEHLFIILKNPYLKHQFETEFGYALLSALLTRNVLKRINEPLSIEFWNLVLEYCGLNIRDPSLSIVKNREAYKNLVLNLELWISCTHKTPAVYELVRFLLFQIDWIQNSNNRNYNRMQLQGLKIIESFTIQQHLGFNKNSTDNIFIEMSSDFVNFYKSLLDNDLTSRNIFYFLYFVHYEIKCSFFKSARIVLKALDAVFFAAIKADDQHAISKLCQALSLKLLMLMLDSTSEDEDLKIVILSILFKYLRLRTDTRKTFVRSRGYILLFSILKDSKQSTMGEVIKLLFAFSLGGNLDPIKLETDDRLIIPTGEKVKKIIVEIHYLIISLLEYSVMNDIKENKQNELQAIVCDYISELSAIQERQDIYSIFEPEASKVPEKLVNLLITLSKPQNGLIYEDATRLIRKFVSNNILYHIKNNKPHEFVNYLQALLDMKGTSDIYSGRPATSKTINYIAPAISIGIMPVVSDELLRLGPQLDSLFTEYPNMLRNVVHFFEEIKDCLPSIMFEPSTYLSIHQCILTILESVKHYNFLRRKTTHLNSLIQTEELNIYTLLNLVMEEKLELSAEQWTQFFKSLLFYQESLFSVQVNKFEREFPASFVLFLIYYIQRADPEESRTLPMNCLRTILIHQGVDAQSLAPVISRQYREDIANSFSQILVSNDDEVFELLLSLKIKAILDPIRPEFIQHTLAKKMSLTGRHEIIPNAKVTASLLQMKQHLIDNNLLEAQKIHQLFKRDNISFSQKIVAAEEKRVLNFFNDIEDDVIFYFNRIYNLDIDALEFNKLHGYDSELELIWNIDTCEDCNRMKKRLIGVYDHPSQIALEPSTSDNMRTSSPSVIKRSSSSIKSYCIVVGFESLNLSHLEEDNNRKVLRSLKDGDLVKQIWNCSRVVGLNVHEGILVMGNRYLYFITNYFFSARKKSVINISDAPYNERDKTAALISGSSECSNDDTRDHNMIYWDLSKLTFLIKRPFLLRDVGVEFLFEHGKNCFLSFSTSGVRDDVYRYMDKLPRSHDIDRALFETLDEVNKRTQDIGFRNGISSVSLSTKFANVFSPPSNLLDTFDAINLWKNGYISNFYYLIIINTLAGRTFNDLTQYPVFPWVVADYISDELDLNDPRTFRDLSKPMGAQDNSRMQQFIERYEALSSLGDENSPPFHYGTHYSSAMIVSSYMIRLEPFAKSYLLLQGGKFGPPDRLFNSIERSWKSASSENTTDVRELIPEFYYLPDFLSNVNNYNFGWLQSGDKVGDVILPPWAKNDPKIFISKNRAALESPYVSENLHKWIDLVFGFKQKGEGAINSVNVFNKLSYHGAIDLDRINDEAERRSVTSIIHNFGQTPLQLFDSPHPKRDFKDVYSLTDTFWDTFKAIPNSSVPIRLHCSDTAVKSLTLNYKETTSVEWTGYPSDIIDISGALVTLLKPNSIKIRDKIFSDVHRTIVTILKNYCDNYFITGDDMGLIKVWNVCNNNQGDVSLELVNNCCGHMNGIKEIATANEYNTMLTLDVTGNMYIWDILKGEVIRIISKNASYIAISGSTSNIAMVDESDNLTVYDLNGSVFTSIKLEKTVSNIAFMNFASIEMPKKNICTGKKKISLLLVFEIAL
ncbi:Bph1p Ecym_8134 [Eremothecium cymbalariae DBVPG|uniref:Beige protein homolog 1 n=1 Tax=Eremothecium cymbalariae (strain CBS 270.75 / DBVPG 7215 / KCTC 17166 / NRRL Y-17582) TaxID=931890 RepID=G8JX51_ERECY|nr:Hypothetical protein Ecym_8134 [Eremothecium cymbalariae DBVPG\